MGETNTTRLSINDAEAIKQALLSSVACGSQATCAFGVEETAKALVRAFALVDAAVPADAPAFKFSVQG